MPIHQIATPSWRQSKVEALSGLSRLLLMSIGFLPFVSTVKLPPLPGFWSEWVSTVLAVALLATLNWHKRLASDASTNFFPWSAVPFVGLAILIAAQLALRMPQYPASGLLGVGELAIAGALAVAGANVTRQGGLRSSMDAVATGLMLALAANFAAVLIERAGFEVYIHQLAPREVPERALGLMGQPNTLGVLAVLSWTAAYYRWTTGALRLTFYWLATVMACVIVVASASRAALLCFLVVWMMTYWTVARAAPLSLDASRLSAAQGSWRGRRLLGWSAVLLLAVQLLWKLVPHGAAQVSSAARTTVSPRLELIADAWTLWLNNPLMGVGFGQFSAARLVQASTTMLEPNAAHAHNLVMHLLAELGAVGLLLCVVPIAFVARSWLSRRRLIAVEPELYLATSVTLILLVYSLFEWPLWCAFFLFPLAFMLGCLPQGYWRYRASKSIGVIRTGVWIAVAAGCFVVAADYLRLQQMYTELGRQREARRGTNEQYLEIPPEAEIVSHATFFPLLADYMYARTLAPDGFMTDYKRAIAWRVMLGLPSGETFARYVAFSLAEGDTVEADRWLTVAGTRSPAIFEQAVMTLRVMAQDQRAVAKYLDENGLR